MKVKMCGNIELSRVFVRGIGFIPRIFYCVKISYIIRWGGIMFSVIVLFSLGSENGL